MRYILDAHKAYESRVVATSLTRELLYYYLLNHILKKLTLGGLTGQNGRVIPGAGNGNAHQHAIVNAARHSS